ncbi:MAG TPA: DUF4931 domain-containing protein [Thermoanaerobaculia bacterium]|nr:DUF4931 domain-containing protein [Thermoanaerobaculia bacterium]
MPSSRRHIITGDPILFAPERAERPNAFGNEEAAVCPFCPGNEAMTPPEIERAGEPWHIRVFPNKYPSVEGHEVIVESADHQAAFDEIAHGDAVIETYVRRYRAHAAAAYVALFTNHGRQAGASIDHPHSQLMPLRFIPPRVEREMAAFGADCPLCAAIEQHRREGLVIAERHGFVRIAPRASSHAYEQWIVPLRHVAEIASIDALETEGLAWTLAEATRGTRSVAAAHNVIYMNFPRAPRAHFYIAVVPRLTAIAGFELATGTFIDIMDPAAAVRALR